MSQFISIPCKKGYEIKFTEAISSYVTEVYGEDQRSSHANAFNEFSNMRSKMLTKLFDKHESTINVLTRYLDQFVALECKIPIEENGVRIDFKWDDAFAKDSLFGKKGTLKIASGSYERICVLFNIAAIYSQVAETSNLSDDNGLKCAAKYFQSAAGIFSFLKCNVPNIVQREPTLDLNGDTLSTLNVLMLAQAQELIYTKSVRDSHKEGNIARIAQQASDLYADTLKLMQLNSVKSIWAKDWIPIVAGKQAGYHAMAEYFQAKACGINQAFGEQIARFKKAQELLKTSSTRAGVKFMFRIEQEKLKRELETVEKENNVIYHDKVPDIATLSAVSKAVLAKEIPIENPINKDFKDLFDRIVPIAVHSAMSMFQNKRNAMVNAEVYRLKEANNLLSVIMASLNLPGALDDGTGDEVPSNLLSKAANIRKEGGVAKIEELLNGLPDVMSRNLDILNESTKMLDEEQDSDVKLKEQFKNRWNRTPSGKLTEGWRTEAQKFHAFLEQAKVSDEVVRKLYQEHSSQIYILSQNEATIKESIPKSSALSGTGNEFNSAKETLRKLCFEVEELKSARGKLIEQITGLEMSSVGNLFTKAIAEDPGLNQEQFAEDQINKCLSPVREKVRESISLQEKLVGQLQENSSNWNTTGSTGENRATIISGLMLAGDKFFELQSNLGEGLKFYAELTELLLKFQNKVKDFCFARKTEKDELMKDLQTAIIREKTDTNPPKIQNIQATSGGTEFPQHNSASNPNPTRPPPTYQNASPAGVPVAPMAAATGPCAPPPNQPPMGMPYHPNPYNMPPSGYMPGHPYPMPPPQMPQYQGFPPYPPSGYNSYPGYNPYYPR